MLRTDPVAASGNVDGGDVEAAGGHEVGWDRFVAGGNDTSPVPGDHPAVHLHEIAEHFPGREDVVHAAVEHGPAVADIGSVEAGRFSAFLEHADGHFL